MIYLGADHGGFELKEKIKEWLKEWKLEFKDLGAHKLDPEDDYPQFAFAVAENVSREDDMNSPWKKRAKGILACRSAGGVVIAANKMRDVRAVAVTDEKSAKHAREHNDANVLALSGDWMNDKQAKDIVKIWLDTEFSKEERHRRRINQIREKEYGGGCGCGGNCGHNC
jgi:ribose 5-phosphate isomerase B